jgi:hypothetical protein
LFDIANLLPNLSNTNRYRETKNACQKWMQEHGEQELLTEIDQLEYNQEGLYKLSELLSTHGVQSTFVKHHAKALDLPCVLRYCL